MNITEKSSKADIIDTAVEFIDTQQEQITTLQSQQRVLVYALSAVVIWSLLF